MIKDIEIIQCDICGETREVSEHDSKGKIVLPDRWKKGFQREDVHICPVCASRLRM